jgi:hypothetical protein
MLLLSVLSLAVASAASNNFSVNLSQAVTVNGTEFKPGDAKVELKDNKVVLKQGKVTAELPARVENSDHKYVYTAVGYTSNHQLKDLCVGGSTTHIVFAPASDNTSIPTGGRQ